MSSARLCFLCILFVLVPLYSFGQTQSKEPTASISELSQTLEEVTAKVSPGVVQIFVSGYGYDQAEGASGVLTRQRGSGSGVVVAPDGFIVTNAHVIKGAQKIQVALPVPQETKTPGNSILKPKGRLLPARLVGMDSETDLAVLKVADTNLTYLHLGDSDELKPGELVLAFGSPLGLHNSVTLGVVSAVARQLRPEDPMIYIQTDATINPGNSGGPLVNLRGQVVGINTSILTQSGGSEGIGFAAPSNIVRTVYEQVRETGNVHRGEIGVATQTVTPLLADGLSLNQDWGVLIADVDPQSSAARAELQPGDLILTVDGKIVENARQFDINLYRRKEGDIVNLQILRAGVMMNVPVVIAVRPQESDRFSALINDRENLIQTLGILGLEMDDEIAKLIPGLRKQYGIIVAARVANAPYSANVFQVGDVIHSVNGEFITSLGQFQEKLKSIGSGSAVAFQIERQGKLLFVATELD